MYLKFFIKYFLYQYKLKQLKKKSIIGERFVFNLNTEVSSRNKYDIKIEDNVMLYGQLVSMDGGKIKIGQYTNIREGCKVFCSNSISIADNVIFADNVIISDTNHHPIHPKDRLKMIASGWSSDLWSWKNAKSIPVVIESNVWLGQYSRVLKGVRIGENSIIASNSVVTKDVPANSIVAGNPAVIVKKDIHLDDTYFI